MERAIRASLDRSDQVCYGVRVAADHSYHLGSKQADHGVSGKRLLDLAIGPVLPSPGTSLYHRLSLCSVQLRSNVVYDDGSA